MSADIVAIAPLIAAVLTAAAVLFVDLAWPGRSGPAIGAALIGLAITAVVTIQVGTGTTLRSSSKYASSSTVAPASTVNIQASSPSIVAVSSKPRS